MSPRDERGKKAMVMSNYVQREDEIRVRRARPVRAVVRRFLRGRHPSVRFRTPLIRRTFGRGYVGRGRYLPWGRRAGPTRPWIFGRRVVGRTYPRSWLFRGAAPSVSRVVRPWIYRTGVSAPSLPWIFGSYPWTVPAPEPPPPVVAEPPVAEPAAVAEPPPPEEPPPDAEPAQAGGDGAGDAPPEGEFGYRARWARRRARWARRRRMYDDEFA
ncbi:hypothetical protein LVJ94_22015 [Pendulispora rubella]|uniref:Uncharacterized protein n=1 Tax=Pendulispora rubella TaxID=2741070 RepID=A0ABZ2LG50_9BACT